MAGLDSTWRWRVSHRDITEIAEALEPVVAKSAPLLTRMSYVITRPNGTTLDYNGDLRKALRHVTDPVAIQVPYTDAGRSMMLGALWIEVKVRQSRLGCEVDLTVTGPGTDSTDERMERARDRVDAELRSRGWKLGDAEVVTLHTEATGSPSAPPDTSHLPRKDAPLTRSAAAKYLGVTRKFLDVLIENGTLPAELKKVGNRTTISLSLDDLERYRVARDARNAANKPSPDTSSAAPIPPASSNTAANADAAKFSGRWKRFWDSKLGAWTANQIFGTLFLGGLAAVGAALLVDHMHQNSTTQAEPPAPAAGTNSTTSAVTSHPPSEPASTTTAVPVPPVLPPRPTEEKEIPDGPVVDFFDGALTVGSGGAGMHLASFNFSSGQYVCKSTYFNLGQAKVIPGQRGEAPDFFRITLTDIEGTSAKIRAMELPPEQWPHFTDGSYDTSCPSQYS